MTRQSRRDLVSPFGAKALGAGEDQPEQRDVSGRSLACRQPVVAQS